MLPVRRRTAAYPAQKVWAHGDVPERGPALLGSARGHLQKADPVTDPSLVLDAHCGENTDGISLPPWK